MAAREIIEQVAASQLHEQALCIFSYISHMESMAGDHKRKFIERTDKLHLSIQEQMRIRYILEYSEDVRLTNRYLIVDGESFESPVFKKLMNENLIFVVTSTSTIGDVEYQSRSAFDQYYFDMWGTSYASALSQYIYTKVENSISRGYVSEPIGPGYYEMDSSELEKIFRVNEGQKIGVHIEGNMMIPIKSMTNFYLVFDKEPRINLAAMRCKLCKGRGIGCDYCTFNRKVFRKKERKEENL